MYSVTTTVWDKLESHTKFQHSEDFKGVMQAMQPLLDQSTDEPVFIRHFNLRQDPYELAGDDAPLQDIICLAMTSDISNERMMQNAKPMRDVCEKMGKRQVSAISIDKELSKVYFATNVFKDWKEGKEFAESESHQKAMKEVPPGGVERFVVGGHIFPIMVYGLPFRRRYRVITSACGR